MAANDDFMGSAPLPPPSSAGAFDPTGSGGGVVGDAPLEGNPGSGGGAWGMPGGDSNADGGQGPGLNDEPGGGPPDRDNSPLSLPGTFAQPGSAGSAPFRTANFLTGRQIGGRPGNGKRKFGPGVPVTGGAGEFGLDEDKDELVNGIMGGLFPR